MNKIILNRELYSINAIKRAVSDYDGIATIVSTEIAVGWECLFTDCKYDIAKTAKEFDNYCIDLMGSRKNDC